MPGEQMTAQGRIALGRDGGRALVLEPPVCTACSGCLWHPARTVRCDDIESAGRFAPGRSVTVALPAAAAVEAAAWLYGLPLLGLLCGAACGAWLLPSDLAAVLGALGGLALAVSAMRHARARVEQRIRCRLSVTAGD